jgi:MOSC domain-containing protein YiiM
MSEGTLVSIHVIRAAEGPPEPVPEARAVPGRGIEGDRYFERTGKYSAKNGPEREVTLIEEEAIEAVRRDYGIDLGPGQSRRNLLTRGVALNHLVNREFEIGEVRLRGLELCEPCSHLESLTAQGVRRALMHRGGLRAQVLRGGTFRVGDPVRATS